ncbi:hypothetical protein [Amycolatopsis pigmentata]|uniref:Uncharacterized protein n=1 Tax=Amycolatopsis pigmentata TaxID=450801 RepID=A0ABW5G048_9PSEU
MDDGDVVSPDGTTIRFSIHGTGPTLVDVPGVLAPLGMYLPLVASLVLDEPPLSLLGEVLVPMLRHCRKAVAEGRPEDAARTALAVSGSPRMRDEGPTRTTLARLAPLVPGHLHAATSATGTDGDSEGRRANAGTGSGRKPTPIR